MNAELAPDDGFDRHDDRLCPAMDGITLVEITDVHEERMETSHLAELGLADGLKLPVKSISLEACVFTVGDHECPDFELRFDFRQFLDDFHGASFFLS